MKIKSIAPGDPKRRVIAYFIDAFIVFIVFSIFSGCLGFPLAFIIIGLEKLDNIPSLIQPENDVGKLLLTIIIGFLFLIFYCGIEITYFSLSESKWHGTIGKRICGLSTTNDRGEQITLRNSLKRALVKVTTGSSAWFLFVFLFPLLGFVPCIAFLPVIMSKKQQALHDRFAQTYVSMEVTEMASINISGGNVVLNSGQIEKVEQINTTIERLEKSGEKDKQEVAVALKNLTAAVKMHSEISENIRTEILDQLGDISKQADEPPESRIAKGTIKGILTNLEIVMNTISHLSVIWSTWGPTISRFFGVD